MGAARIFVDAISRVSVSLGVPALVFSLLVAPIATELPEQLNGVLWLRRRKDTLAIGNVTGAMVFQSTFPVTIGLFFTPWHLTQEGMISGLIAVAAGLVTYATHPDPRATGRPAHGAPRGVLRRLRDLRARGG